MSHVLHVGTRKGLFELQRTNSGWKVASAHFLGIQVPMLLHDNRDASLYAALEHGHFGGKMHVRRGGSVAWDEVTCPQYPPKPEDVPDVICAMSQQPIPWSLKKLWALEPGGPDQPGLLWCGTIPGGLFQSTDAGATWRLVESLWNMPERHEWFGGGADWPGIHSIIVDPRDSTHVFVGVSCGGVWETRDAGATWTCRGEGLQAEYMPPGQQQNPNIQDPHRISACHAAPDTIWMQHHNGIFVTTDGAATWRMLETADPSSFGFPVATHPQDPLTAWFVPGVKDEMRVPCGAALCVMRTRDGGRSFQSLRKGLPQDHAYHVVYRHALDVSADGRTLAFGSTTGSLWLSADGGESWERLSADLPPVYCVRFAG